MKNIFFGICLFLFGCVSSAVMFAPWVQPDSEQSVSVLEGIRLVYDYTINGHSTSNEKDDGTQSETVELDSLSGGQSIDNAPHTSVVGILGESVETAEAQKQSQWDIENVHLKDHPKMQEGFDATPPEADIALLNEIEASEVESGKKK